MHQYLAPEIQYGADQYTAHPVLPAYQGSAYPARFDQPSYTPLFAQPQEEPDLNNSMSYFPTDIPRGYNNNASDQSSRPFATDTTVTDPQLAQTPAGKQKQKYKCTVKPGCEKTFDFLSLLRKHEATHTRPEICQYCSKKFASKTDRQRHINNVHLSNPSSAFAYKCRYGSCASKSKLYLRPDNFKTHLKRKHKPSGDADEDAFYAQAEKDCRVSMSSSNNMQQHKPVGLANDAEVDHGEDNRNGYAAKEKPYPPPWEGQRHDAVIGHLEPYTQSHVQPSGGFHTMETGPRMLEADFLQTSPGTHGYPSATGPPTTLAHNEAPVEAATILASLRDQSYNNNSNNNSNGLEHSFTGLLTDDVNNDSIPIDPAMTGGLTEVPRTNTWPQQGTFTDEIMAEPESERPLINESTANNPTSPPRLRTNPLTTRGATKRSSAHQTATPGITKGGISKASTGTQKPGNKAKKIPCTYEFCTSSFQKPRDLRKHLTRHVKPYMCTQPGCEGVFGSKNDWVRHEKSQHFRLEYWTCPLKDLEAGKNHYAVKYLSSKCSTIFFRKESLQQHLRGRHQENLNVVMAVLKSPDQPYPPKDLIPNATYDNNLENEIVKLSFKQKKDDDPFWCGFCEQEINEKGSVRYEHIGRHFDQMKKEEVEKKTWVPKPGALSQDYFLSESTAGSDEARRELQGNTLC